MLPLPKDKNPSRLEFSLVNGNFDKGYVIDEENNYHDLNLSSESEHKLLSCHAQTILFQGKYYKMDKDFPRAQIISDKKIIENLKYTCFGFN